MKFYITNTELDALIAEIRRKIRLSMNGITSEQMEKKGIVYKMNFGVSIPRIREIAKLYEPNHDLAQRLWHLQIRETMILATLLQPVEKFDLTTAERWAESFNQIEIIEQCCMNLFCKLDDALLLALKWISSDDKWLQTTGFTLVARIADKLSIAEIAEIVDVAILLSSTDELHLYKSISLCLSRLSRKGKNTATYILNAIGYFSQSLVTSQQYIYNEVKQEILFLDIL